MRIKRQWGWALGVLLACVVFSAQAVQEIDNPFGVRIALPEHWLKLTQEQLSTVDPAEGENSIDLPLETRQLLSAQLRAGGVMLIFNTQPSEQDFYDNITVIEIEDQVPEAAAQIRQTCQALPRVLSQRLGQTIRLDQCAGREISGFPAFILAYPGKTPATQIVQYMIQIGQNRSLVFTLAYHQQRPESLAAFEQLITDLELRAP